MMAAFRIAGPCPSSRLPTYVLPVPTSLLRIGRGRAISLGVLLLGTVPLVAGAQGLPAYRPINPILASRSALGFQPLVAASPRWRVAMALDWANSIDFNSRPPAEYSLDGEFMRLDGDDQPRHRSAALCRGHAWGHQGAAWIPRPLRQLVASPVRHLRVAPRGTPRERLRIPDRAPGRHLADTPCTGLYVTDARLTFGVRHSPRWQTALTVALPTSTRLMAMLFTALRPRSARRIEAR